MPLRKLLIIELEGGVRVDFAKKMRLLTTLHLLRISERSKRDHTRRAQHQ